MMSGFLSGPLWLVFIAAVLSAVQECQSYDDFCPDWAYSRCADGTCIRRKFLCDKWVDCENGEDEATCVTEATPARCPRWHFACADRSKCVSITFRCYGSPQCFDESDEANCPTHQCGRNDKACQTGDQCIFSNYWCDGDNDCEDGSDESNCNTTVCDGDSFNCGNGVCIPDDWRCDGEPDCDNGSDETCRTPLTQCWPGDRSCTRSRECISEEKFCDGTVGDCRDGLDEEDCPVSNVTQTPA